MLNFIKVVGSSIDYVEIYNFRQKPGRCFLVLLTKTLIWLYKTGSSGSGETSWRRCDITNLGFLRNNEFIKP